MSEPKPDAVDSRANLARQRTSMASYRTQLALDRTTLAWVRTAPTMASFDFGMVAFFRSLQDQSPSPETIRLHRGVIRMGPQGGTEGRRRPANHLRLKTIEPM
jgi:uncharacterized membrane protein YidH (DUF202 family)